MTISRISAGSGYWQGALLAIPFAVAVLALGGQAATAQEDDRRAPPQAGDAPPPIATDKPRSIIPGPYVPKGSMKDYQGVAAGDAPVTAERVLDEMERVATEEGEQPIEGRPAVEGIEAGELRALDPSATGVLEPERGGFPLDFWRGTSRRTIERLLPLLPVGARSPTANTMARRLLLSAVALPRNQAQTIAEAQDHNPYFILETRLERLLASGDLGALMRLLDRVSPEQETPAIRQIRLEGYLLAGDILAACDVAERARTREGASRWLKVTALCQAVSADRGLLSMTTGLLEESGDMTLRFAALLDAVLARAEGQNILPEIEVSEILGEAPDALTVAMFRAAGVPIPADALDTASPRVLGALATRPDLDIELRAEAAELAAAKGVIEAKRLADIFDAMEFTDGERASALLLAETDLGARVDALLYNLTRTEADEHARMRYLAAAWARARREGLMPALAPVFARAAKTIRPNDDLVSYAHDLARLALYAGDRDMAGQWYEVARRNAALRDVEATRVLVAMWPLMFVADAAGDIPYSVEILDLWRQNQAVLPAEEQNTRAALLYSLIEALGTPVSSSLWADVVGAPAVDARPGPSLAQWRQLILAAEERRVGEGVLLSLMALGEAGPGDINPSALSTVVRSLTSLGLEAEARALAVEAMVSAGF